MKMQSLTLKALGMILLLSATMYAEEFAFHNKTKEPVSIALGSAHNPPTLNDLQEVGPNKITQGIVNISKDDAAQLLLVLNNDVKFVFQLNSAPGKAVKLKLTTSLLNGKIDLEPQIALNNIKKDEIVLIGAGSI
jgi:hypothetical protein